MMSLSWPHVLTWRLRRHFLHGPGAKNAIEVTRRLVGVQAQVPSQADLAVGIRLATPAPATLTAALKRRRLVRTWAMRGTLHALAPEQAGSLLAVLGHHRPWDRPAWQKAFGLTPKDIRVMSEAALVAMDGRSLSREELIDGLLANSRNQGLREHLSSGWSTLLKPLAWQGLLCHGTASENGRVRFARPDQWVTGWVGLPDLEVAGSNAIRWYLRAYAPGNVFTFCAWMSRTLPKKQVRAWFDAVRPEASTVDVAGEERLVLTEDLDDLMATTPERSVTLLSGFDQWLLGPGTDAVEVVPAERRWDVSRTAGWISPTVLSQGRAVGVWDLKDTTVRVTLWERVARKALEAEVARITPALGAGGAVTLTVQQG